VFGYFLCLWVGCNCGWLPLRSAGVLSSRVLSYVAALCCVGYVSALCNYSGWVGMVLFFDSDSVSFAFVLVALVALRLCK